MARIVDRAAFAQDAGLTVSEGKIDECSTETRGWTLCAFSGQAHLPLLGGGGASLTKRAKSAFKQSRGDVEAFFAFESGHSLQGAAIFEGGKIRGRYVVTGVEAAGELRAIDPAPFLSLRENASGYAVFTLPDLFKGMLDSSGLTGSVMIATGTDAPMKVVAPTKTGNAAQGFVKEACALAMQFREAFAANGGKIAASKGGCEFALSPKLLPQVAYLHALSSVSLSSREATVVLQMGHGDGRARPSKVPNDTAKLFSKTHVAVAWGLPLVSPQAGKNFVRFTGAGPEPRDTAWLAVANILHDVGFSIDVAPHALSGEFHATLMADDGQAVHEKTIEITRLMAQHKFDAADEKLKTLVKLHPDSLAADIQDKSGLSMMPLGVVTAVTIPAMIAALQRTNKNSEFEGNLRVMAEGARRYHARHGDFPASVPLTPAPVTCDKKPADTDWTAFSSLQFDVSKVFFGHYEFEREGPHSAVARVKFDADCDGNHGVMEISIRRTPQTSPDVQMGVLVVVNED